jgi:hypothetical protein
MGAQPGLASVPDFSLASIPFHLILAHGGIPGLIAETSIVFLGLGVFGYFIRRSAKKEREREEESKPDGPPH